MSLDLKIQIQVLQWELEAIKKVLPKTIPNLSEQICEVLSNIEKNIEPNHNGTPTIEQSAKPKLNDLKKKYFVKK